jgi:hypothetical protein
MRLAVMLLACLPWIGADESSERAAIESAFRALNAATTRTAVVALFTSDADAVDIDRLFRTHQDLVQAARRPWSERTLPHISVRSLRFLTADVALADATDTQFASIGPRRIPILFLLKRDGPVWRFAVARLE